MIPRYANQKISEIWSNENKLRLWQKTELAVIRARVNLSQIAENIYSGIDESLRANPIDIDWWLARDKEIGHDLNAFIDERLKFLPINLQPYFHDGMTSYDTEEPALASMLFESLFALTECLNPIMKTLEEMAVHYRYTIMNGRTHGQEADLQSFGKRCLTWLIAVKEDGKNLAKAAENTQYSKLSGAIGNYRALKPEVETEALRLLQLKPFYGATQIMPRELYAPIAQAVCQLVLTLDKIATDIRLGARSGRPIYQEPFGKKQKGSSAMPHKKNTISCEQLEGMARMAKGYLLMIMDNIKTWEERAIEQSCVERNAWPDLFHTAIHSAKTITKVLQGLTVYPDNMLAEIIDSRGCYAAGEAKEFLRHHGAKHGLSAEDAYRIVQLAAFNVFEPNEFANQLRQDPPRSFADAESALSRIRNECAIKPINIHDVIGNGRLIASNQLEINAFTVKVWNQTLCKIFADEGVREKWDQVFMPSNLLKGEDTLYEKILGC